MKIIKLPDDDRTLLQAAYAAYQEASESLEKARRACRNAQATYEQLVGQLCAEHHLNGSASDDQHYLYGHPVEPAPKPATSPAQSAE